MCYVQNKTKRVSFTYRRHLSRFATDVAERTFRHTNVIVSIALRYSEILTDEKNSAYNTSISSLDRKCKQIGAYFYHHRQAERLPHWMMVLKEGLQPILLEWAFCPNFCKGGGMRAAGLERFKREGDVSVISQRGDKHAAYRRSYRCKIASDRRWSQALLLLLVKKSLEHDEALA